MADSAPSESAKLPRGIERSGTAYRVTISIAGVPERRHRIPTLPEAITIRDELDARAKLVRTQRRLGKAKTPPVLVGTLMQASAVGASLASNGKGIVKGGKGMYGYGNNRPASWGIESRLVRDVVKYAVRVWVKGKMRWGGTFETLEEALAARDVLKGKQLSGEL